MKAQSEWVLSETLPVSPLEVWTAFDATTVKPDMRGRRSPKVE